VTSWPQVSRPLNAGSYPLGILPNRASDQPGRPAGQPGNQRNPCSSLAGGWAQAGPGRPGAGPRRKVKGAGGNSAVPVP